MSTTATLEVNGMHALHRPHTSRAIMVTIIAAVLAIVLALALAPRLNDLTSTSASGAPTATPTPVQSAGARWNLNPFTSLLRSPVRVPWTAGF
ncbi:MAG: hypothetical protein ACTHQQ_13260 [Solirubrobacteraceae bacterium]